MSLAINIFVVAFSRTRTSALEYNICKAFVLKRAAIHAENSARYDQYKKVVIDLFQAANPHKCEFSWLPWHCGFMDSDAHRDANRRSLCDVAKAMLDKGALALLPRDACQHLSKNLYFEFEELR